MPVASDRRRLAHAVPIRRIAVGAALALAVVYAFALQRAPSLPFTSAADPLGQATLAGR